MKIRRMLSITVCIVLCAFAVGCAQNTSVSTKTGNIKYPEEGIYPLQTDGALTVWCSLTPSETLQTSALGLAWQKETGIEVEFQQASSNESLSLLVASNDLPDILITTLANQSGGLQKYVDDGVVISIGEHMENYAPNLKKILDNNAVIDRMVKSDEGKYYMFPFIRGDDLLTVSSGPVVRKDILDNAGMTVPETIDEWYKVLKLYKESGFNAPLSYDLMTWEGAKNGIFLGAYGTRADFYIDDGKIKYGFLEPEMKDALANLKKWYEEGLLDKNIVKVSDMDASILNSDVGASCMWAGSGIGRYMKAAAEKNPEFELVAAPLPVLNKGDKPEFGVKEFIVSPANNGFITTACNNIELAMRFLDFGYSERGHMLLNFGIEGESYNMINDYPTYTDLITKNPDGLSMSQVMQKYVLSMGSGPFVQDIRYIEQYYNLQQQKDALIIWENTNVIDHNIPPITFTGEESSKLNTIMNNVKTYVDEMIFKFIMGIEPMEKYDSFVNNIKNFGIDEAITIYEHALSRYRNR